VSFGTLPNARTEYITFNMVAMSYPYNAIFGRGDLGDSCAHAFIARSNIFWYCLIRIYVLFGILFIYLFRIACFRSLSLGADDFENL
jgi:hypothetical protein